MNRFCPAGILSASLWLALLPCAAAEDPPEAGGTRSGAPIDFKSAIQPIFEQRCYECHDKRKQKSGLRLDRKTGAFQGGDSGKPAVVPAKVAESLLITRVTTTNADEVMPPKGQPLTADQISLLKTWVEQGASWPEEMAVEKTHWAYLKPGRPPLPKVQNTRWPRNPIDHFVLARLEKEGLKPSPPAARAALLRRATLDLTGLPPTLAEIDAFLADESPDAYEKVVDRLLASPAYGERWARPWLDLARYADTQGYEKDNRRNMWPYRDWVIKALNQDMPFDEFTIEQLAGDLLPDATQDQKVATGFHRNTMTNTEGGTDNEEFRHEAVVDRVNTTFAVWMGSTLACAQCHNHKYDPLTMREYYQFYAFLNNTTDADSDDEKPTMKVPTPQQAAELAKLRTELTGLEKEFDREASKPEIASAREEWEQKTLVGLTNWQALDPTEFTSLGGATLSKTPSKSIVASGANSTNDTYFVLAPVGSGRLTGIRLEVLETGESKALGRREDGGFVLRKFEIAVKTEAAATARLVDIQSATADASRKDFNITNVVSGTGSGWSVDTSETKNRIRRSAYFTLAEPLQLPEGASLAFTLRHSGKYPFANIARFRLYGTSSKQVGPPTSLPDDVRTSLLTAAEKRDQKQHARLKEYFESIAPELAATRAPLLAKRKEVTELDNAIPITSVLEELPPEKSRQTHMLLRGSFLNKGEEVSPGTPAALHPFSPDYPRNRLGMARWLVDTNNPLTARVIVNRFWEQYFGRGLVETVEEFGSQGELPSHPELLDWLATEFMAPQAPVKALKRATIEANHVSTLPPFNTSTSGPWSMKHMHRLIVTSATYRQSSRISADLHQRDPYNRWMARGPRVRLEAEMIRDQALAVSGLLTHKIGGQSVMPPQPEGLWMVVYNSEKWETSKGDDKYRRGLYTFWRRSNPHPAMTTFDAPSREFCVLKRSRSNTPLQALNILNDPVYVEAAQALARRIAGSGPTDLKGRVTYAFRLCLARLPNAREVERVIDLYQTELANFRMNRQAAEKMATSQLGMPADDSDLSELAAWTVIANVLLNLDEMITKG